MRMHNIRPCDDDLPLLVLADDLYGDVQLNAIEPTGDLYKTASWYNLMTIAYSNVGRHAHVAYHQNNTHRYPLFGSDYKVHLGIGFHVAIAWKVLFIVGDALYETCVGDAVAPSRTTFHEPNTKHRGRYGPTPAVRQEWEANLHAKGQMCNGSSSSSASTRSDPAKEPSRFATNLCTYGWIMHLRSSVAHPWHVQEAMEPVLVEATGWRAKPVLQRRDPNQPHPRTGWYGDAPNATFSLLLTNLTMATTSLTVISMKSYGREWANSTLQVQLTVTRDRGGGRGSGGRAPQATSSQTFTIDGYHETRTSAHFAHKLPLPGGPAGFGDTIRADSRLVSGSVFKIKGLAFCDV